MNANEREFLKAGARASARFSAKDVGALEFSSPAARRKLKRRERRAPFASRAFAFIRGCLTLN